MAHSVGVMWRIDIKVRLMEVAGLFGLSGCLSHSADSPTNRKRFFPSNVAPKPTSWFSKVATTPLFAMELVKKQETEEYSIKPEATTAPVDTSTWP